MTMKRLRLGLFATVLVLALAGWACSSGGSSTPAAVDSPESASASEAPDTSGGKKESSESKNDDSKDSAEVELAEDPAPEFEVESFSGETFAIREQLGTPVVLNFWESW
jgi:hypothetical protein